MNWLPLIFTLFMFVVYWGGMAMIISTDAKREREKARAGGSVDFMDRSPVPYMLLGVLCGPLPLIFYFGTTRKSVGGWLAGVGIGVGWSILNSVVFNVGVWILGRALRG
jgi:hypothetical protein